LDLACGPALSSKKILEKYFFNSVTLMDNNSDFLKVCNNFKNIIEDIKIKKCDILKDNLDQYYGLFDLILCNGPWSDIFSFYLKALKLSKKGGFLLMVMPVFKYIILSIISSKKIT
jgi:hypothetical protein